MTAEELVDDADERLFSKVRYCAYHVLEELLPPKSKPHPRTKHEVDRITRSRDMAIRVCWGMWNPRFGGRRGRRGSAMAPLERAMVVSYRLSIVTVAYLLPFGRNLRSNVYDAQINSG